jgi:hypothetical protein
LPALSTRQVLIPPAGPGAGAALCWKGLPILNGSITFLLPSCFL